MQISVTGANGWLGLTLARAISRLSASRAIRARALILPQTSGAEVQRLLPDADVVSCDVRNASECEAALRLGDDCEHVVIHTAGVIHPRHVRDFYDINVTGTSNVLDAARNAGATRVVIVSSNSPCGCNPYREHRFDEDSPYAPYMIYGRSKMLMEREALARHQRGDCEVVIVRAPWFYGPYQPARQKQFFRMIRDGRVPIVGDGQNLRSMAFTESLADGLLLAACTPRAAGQIYWMADENPYSMQHIITTIAAIMETEFRVPCAQRQIRLPSAVSEMALGADWAMQTLGIYHQKVHVLSEMNKTISCSVAKAKEELGYRPAQSLDDGMRRSISEWLTQE
jgi:nucleoside-diphosphate-sugar epimerase